MVRESVESIRYSVWTVLRYPWSSGLLCCWISIGQPPCPGAQQSQF